jgi:transcriptional regulator with XRE-family HTH domain
MIVGERIGALRESLNLSQGDIEDRSGLRRCYISRVENGHTVPSVETIQKMAGAMGVPLYRFFYEGTKPPEPPPFLVNRHRMKWPRIPSPLIIGRVSENISAG